jgi:hypothetical protein
MAESDGSNRRPRDRSRAAAANSVAVRILTCVALVGVAFAALLPMVTPGLRPAQLGLSLAAFVAALVSPARSLLRLGDAQRWRLLRLGGVVILVAAAVVAWGFGAFMLDHDYGFLVSRDLAMVIDGPTARYYVYQVSSIPDGWDGVEIMERSGLVRVPVWQASSPPLAAEVFDGRTLRLGRHHLRLAALDRRLAAWVDGAPARVQRVR